MTEIKRKLYKRGSSFETTIPMPLLFAIDKSKKHNVIFKFDDSKNKWYVEFEKIEEDKKEAREGKPSKPQESETKKVFGVSSRKQSKIPEESDEEGS